MPNFSYRAKNASGALVNGTIEAKDQRTASERLKFQKFIVINIAEAFDSPLKKFLKKINPIQPSVSSKSWFFFHGSCRHW